MQQEIYRQMEVNARRQAAWSAPQAPAAAATAPTIAEQIQQLAALRDQGHISEAEFQAKKSDLLSRM